MSTKNKKRLIAVVLVLLTLALLIRFLTKSKDKETEKAGNELATGLQGVGTVLANTITNVTDAVTGGAGGAGSPSQTVGCNKSCCTEYAEEINQFNPSANVGTCGDKVYQFQGWLNQWANDKGVNTISVDGAYGNMTKNLHESFITYNLMQGGDSNYTVYDYVQGGTIQLNTDWQLI